MWNKNLVMTRDQIREYDRYAIEKLGFPSLVLMENAGSQAALIAREILSDNKKTAVIAGPGNNGGDGFVVARHLINMGFDVKTFMAVPREKVKGDALTNLVLLENDKADIIDISDPESTQNLKTNLSHNYLIIDALLGTGATREVKGHFADLIKIINSTNTPVLSLDMPSGLDANTGLALGICVNADATATFGHLKRGLVLYPGASFAGKTHVLPLGVFHLASAHSGWDCEVLSRELVSSLLPPRKANSHKGTYGHLLALSGTSGKSGAAALLGTAAMRSGTGLCTIVTTKTAAPVIEAKCMEVMVESLLETKDSQLTEKLIKKMDNLMERKSAIALGPGLSTSPGISKLALELLKSAKVPAVVDADGINILANNPSCFAGIKTQIVLTPHPGEMARLTGKSVAEVQADRIDISRETACKLKVIIVLKGANTVIASPDGRVFINPTGNSGMAKGGTGDVLTGLIGGLIAQGISCLSAALAGTYIHGMAGDIASTEKGEISCIATDLMEKIPEAFAKIL